MSGIRIFRPGWSERGRVPTFTEQNVRAVSRTVSFLLVATLTTGLMAQLPVGCYRLGGSDSLFTDCSVTNASMAVEVDDHAIVTGGKARLVLADMAATSDLTWSKRFYFANLYGGRLMAQQSDGGYLLCGGMGQLTKTNTDGALQWAKAYAAGTITGMAATNSALRPGRRGGTRWSWKTSACSPCTGRA